MNDFQNICNIISDNISDVFFNKNVEIVIIEKDANNKLLLKNMNKFCESFEVYHSFMENLSDYKELFPKYALFFEYFNKKFETKNFEEVVSDYSQILDIVEEINMKKSISWDPQSTKNEIYVKTGDNFLVYNDKSDAFEETTYLNKKINNQIAKMFYKQKNRNLDCLDYQELCKKIHKILKYKCEIGYECHAKNKNTLDLHRSEFSRLIASVLLTNIAVFLRKYNFEEMVFEIYSSSSKFLSDTKKYYYTYYILSIIYFLAGETRMAIKQVKEGMKISKVQCSYEGMSIGNDILILITN